MRVLAGAILASLVVTTLTRAATPPATPPPVDTEPGWLRKPTQAELERFWPVDSRGMRGRVVISSAVTVRGLLDECDVVSEEPVGHGFGGAALALAPSFLMRPM